MTSSAVVGSSKITSSGRQAKAVAMTTRCFSPAGCLVRIAPHHRLGIPDADAREHRGAFARRRFAVEPAMQDQRLEQLLSKRQRRVERSAGILEHHADPRAADPCQRGGIGRGELDIAEADRALGLARVGGEVAHDRPGERGLSRAGLANQAEHLAGGDLEREIGKRMDRPAPASHSRGCSRRSTGRASPWFSPSAG